MLELYVLLLVLPSSLLLWTVTTVLHVKNYTEPVSPFRWLFTFMLPIAIAQYGYRRKSLNTSGAITALFVGFILTLSNFCFCAALLSFFITASRLTKFRAHKKRKLEHDFREGGQRNWLQVICNGGIASELALIYIMEAGCHETIINFSHKYNTSWLCMSVLGALACCSGDTYASEIGAVVGWGNPRLLTTMKKVPRGTNGAISLAGTVSSLIGGIVVGLAYYIVLMFCATPEALELNPPQWPIIIVGGLAGLLGSMVDSFLGSTLQYSGYDTVKGCIVERPGEKVVHISGSPILDNHSINLLSSFITCLITPALAMSVWERILY